MFSRSALMEKLMVKQSENCEKSKACPEDSMTKQERKKLNVLQNVLSKYPIILEAYKSGVFSSDEFNDAVMFIFQSFTKFEEEPIMQRQEIRCEIAGVVQQSKMAFYMVEIFRKCIEKGLPSRFNDNTKSMTEYVCTSLQILRIIDNFTSCSHKFCKYIVSETELLEIIFPFLQEVEEEFINSFRNEVIKKLVEFCISISYNIVKHEDLDLIDKMHTTGMFTAMQPYLKSSDVRLRMCVLMFFAYVVNEDEASKYCTDDESLLLILQNLDAAIKNKEKESNGRPLIDILRVISKLASLDISKKKFGDLGAMKIMEQIIQLGNCGEAELTCKVIARLAFEPENAKRIVDGKIDHLIRRRSNDFSSFKMQRASVNIQRAMDLSCDAVDSPKRKPGKHIMISYSSRVNRDLVVRIKDAIKKKGFEVWFDDDKMKYYGNILEGMAAAIEESWLVLICTSWHYKQSENCRLEAQHAHCKGKEMLYLKMDNYHPDGWLGLLMSCKYYFDFKGTFPFEKKCGDLLKRISQLHSEFNVAGIASRMETSKIVEVSELESSDESISVDECKDGNKGQQCQDEKSSCRGTNEFVISCEEESPK